MNGTPTRSSAPDGEVADLAVGFDRAAVSDWIADLDVGFRPPYRFNRIGLGQSNLTFRVYDADGKVAVLRRPPLGELLESAHDVAREHRILAALEGTDVPTPQVYGITADPAISDGPLLLMEHVDGLVIEDVEVADSLPLELRGQIGHHLAGTLARIHAVDLEAVGLADLSRARTPHARRLVRRWHGQWETSRTKELPTIDDLATRLAAAAPPQSEVTLVHGDFHLRNLIVSPEDGKVRAVLDWELTTLGDPIADVGTLLAYWPQPGDRFGSFFPAPSRPGFPSREEMVSIYREASGRSLDTLPYWYALAVWKLAIIGEGIVRRAKDEPTNAAPGGSIPIELVDELASQAAELAQDAGL